MTQTNTTTVLRRPEDRVFRGVCAAIGRATGTDPVLWRVAVVVLTLFGGSGLVLYAAGWLLIPEQGRGSVAERLLRGREPSRPAMIALVVVAAIIVAGSNGGENLVPLAVVGLLAYLLTRRGQVAPFTGPQAGTGWPNPPTAGGGPGWPDPLATGPAPSWPAPLATDPAPWPDPLAAEGTWYSAPTDGPLADLRARRRRSPLVLITLSVTALVVAVLLLLNALGAPGITPPRVLAAALLVVGAGLFVGSIWGRALVLIPVALALVVALAATAWLHPPASFTVGQRTWAAADGGRYELGAGDATLDLTPLRSGADAADVRVHLGVGRLLVLLPDGVHLDLVYDIRGGDVRLPGSAKTSGGRLTGDRTFGPKANPLVTVHASIGGGELEVRNVR